MFTKVIVELPSVFDKPELADAAAAVRKFITRDYGISLQSEHGAVTEAEAVRDTLRDTLEESRRQLSYFDKGTPVPTAGAELGPKTTYTREENQDIFDTLTAVLNEDQADYLVEHAAPGKPAILRYEGRALRHNTLA